MRRLRWPLDRADTRLVALFLIVTFVVLWGAAALGLAARIFLVAKGA